MTKLKLILLEILGLFLCAVVYTGIAAVVLFVVGILILYVICV